MIFAGYHKIKDHVYPQILEIFKGSFIQDSIIVLFQAGNRSIKEWTGINYESKIKHSVQEDKLNHPPYTYVHPSCNLILQHKAKVIDDVLQHHGIADLDWRANSSS